MSLEALFLVVLAAVLLGVYPSWPYSRDWGYGPFILLLLIFALLLALTLMGYVPRLEYGAVLSHGARPSLVRTGSRGALRASMMRLRSRQERLSVVMQRNPLMRGACAMAADSSTRSPVALTVGFKRPHVQMEARRTDKFLADGL